MTITKKVVFIAKDDTIEELKALLGTMVQASRIEPGCLLYNIYQLKDKPKEFVVVESWEDEASLKGHQQTEHYKHYKANFEPFCAEKYSDELVSLG